MAAKLLSGTAFITGAASGIGYNTALAFAKYGIDNLALADLEAGALAEAAKSIQKEYPDVKLLELDVDVRNTEQVKAGIEKTVAEFGRLDVLVNNAGIRGPITDTDETTEEDWSNLIDVNLTGVWRCQKEALKVMLKQEDKGIREGRGKIINTASMFGLFSPPKGLPHVAYTAAKHGVVGLTKADAVIYGEKNIKINCICPGWTKTPLLNQVLAQGDATPLAGEVARCSTKRAGEVEEISDAMVFLASPLSSFMQGASLVVDGGFTLT